MGLFSSSDDDDGCESHHFIVDSETGGDFKIEYDHGFVIKRECRLVCAHMGCVEREYEFVRLGKISAQTDDEGNYSNEDTEALMSTLKQFESVEGKTVTDKSYSDEYVLQE